MRVVLGLAVFGVVAALNSAASGQELADPFSVDARLQARMEELFLAMPIQGGKAVVQNVRLLQGDCSAKAMADLSDSQKQEIIDADLQILPMLLGQYNSPERTAMVQACFAGAQGLQASAG